MQFHSGCFLVVVVAVVCYLFIRYSEFPNDFDHMMNVNWATILCVFLSVCMAQSLFKSPMFDIYTISNDWFFVICVVYVLYRIYDVVSLFCCTINCVDFTGFPLMWMPEMVQLCITICRVLGSLPLFRNTPSHKSLISIYCYDHWHLFDIYHWIHRCESPTLRWNDVIALCMLLLFSQSALPQLTHSKR